MKPLSASKNIILLSIFVLIGLTILGLPNTKHGLAAPSSDFWYYYQDEKVPLPVIEGEIAVGFAGGVRSLDKTSTIMALNSLTAPVEMTELPAPEITLLKLDKSLSKEGLFVTLENLRKDPSVDYAYPVFGTPDSRMILTDQFIARFKPDISMESIYAFNDQNHVLMIKEMGLSDTYLLSVGPNSNVLGIVNHYHESGLTLYAEPNFILSMTPMYAPNDTHYTEQWPMKNNGTFPPGGLGSSGADMEAESAWEIERGEPHTVIAIIDMGVELTHPDLINQILTSYTSIPGDTDANPQSTIYQLDGHGTSCAGIAAADTDNGIGVAGVCPDCSLMPVQVAFTFEFGGNELMYTEVEWVDEGIRWAADNGADIISSSIGGSSPSETINNAISYAVNNGRGGLGTPFFTAAGNDNSGTISWPASFTDTIAVGATDPCDGRAQSGSCYVDGWWSSYGAELDIVAPGVGQNLILSHQV